MALTLFVLLQKQSLTPYPHLQGRWLFLEFVKGKGLFPKVQKRFIMNFQKILEITRYPLFLVHLHDPSKANSPA